MSCTNSALVHTGHTCLAVCHSRKTAITGYWMMLAQRSLDDAVQRSLDDLTQQSVDDSGQHGVLLHYRSVAAAVRLLPSIGAADLPSHLEADASTCKVPTTAISG